MLFRRFALIVLASFAVVCPMTALGATPAAPAKGAMPAKGAAPAAVRRAVTPEQVDKTIKTAIAYLYSLQQADGSWETAPPPPVGAAAVEAQWGGQTALATYALLAAGEDPKDPRLVKAVQFLEKIEMRGVYAVGLRCQVWEMIPMTDDVRACVLKDFKILSKSMRTSGPAKGLFHYLTFSAPNAADYDHSVSQYGVLGMWALAEAGVETPDDLWKTMQSAWQAGQLKDGGWVYINSTQMEEVGPTPTMTAAGIASLFIFEDELPPTGLECGGNISNPYLEKGLAWMSKNFETKVARSPNPYLWYGIQRIGVASGYKYFGNIDWYKERPQTVISTQSGAGGWEFHGVVPGTSFCLLFLSRGRAPVAFNKLDYGQIAAADDKADSHANWNERPRDIAHLTKWVSQVAEIGNFLNWQIVNLSVDVNELHDAPIMFISGNSPVKFSDEQIAKLKQFVEDGGLILCNADCGSRPFVDSMRKLGESKLFPSAGEFRELPEDHPIYNHQEFPRSKWKSKPHLLGLTNGVRELMLIIPDADPAKAWESLASRSKNELFELGGDILQYAVDRQNLYTKGDSYIVVANPAIKATRTMKVARLQAGEDWDPEPGGWRRLSAILHNSYGTDLTVETVKPGDGKLAGYKIAHLTGTLAAKLSDAAKAELKSFVSSGGTLIVDAAGGSAVFADSIEKTLAEIFPDGADGLGRSISLDNPLYTIAGPKMDDVGYRLWSRKFLSGDMKSPRLKGIEQKGRLAVIYSPEDISAGMVGENVDGIVGYNPATATTLMIKILMYADSGGRPTSQPAVAVAPKGDDASAKASDTSTADAPAPMGDNLALHKKYDTDDANKYKFGEGGLTDGSWASDNIHCFASGDTDKFPKQVTIDLGAPADVGCVIMGVPNFGSTKTVEVNVSPDGMAFTKVGSYEFSQSKAEKHVFIFPTVKAQYVQLSYPDHYPDKVKYPATYVFTTECEVYGPQPATGPGAK